MLPLFAGEYWLNAILIPFLVMSLAGLGLNLLMGYTGQASLGTGAFMAVGTYATYNFLLRLPELPLPISLVLGGLVAAGVGVLFGLPSLRIKGFYLLATTLAAQFFLEWMFNQYGWFSNYSTSNSISAPRLVFLGRDLSGPVGRYYLTLATVALLTIAAINIVRSQTGRNWMAIRDMDTAAAVIGIPVAREQAARLRGQLVLLRHCRRALGLCLSRHGRRAKLQSRSFVPGDVRHHHRRDGQHRRQFHRRRIHPASADLDRPSRRIGVRRRSSRPDSSKTSRRSSSAA